MKNKVLLTLTSLLLAGALVACGAKKNNDPTPDTPVEPVDPPTPPTPPAPEVVNWPEAFRPTVQSYLDMFEFTDALPGIADGTNYAANGSVASGYFQIKVDTDAEEKVAPMLAAYQQNLLNANFTEIGKDEYGDMHYASPNGQYDVGPWSGLDAGSPGNFVVIDVAPIIPDVFDADALIEQGFEAVEGWQGSLVEWALEGGTITTFTGVNLEGTWYTKSLTQSSSYGDYRVAGLVSEGLYEEELVVNLTAAGFAYSGTSEGDDRFVSETEDVEVQIHEGEDYTGVYVFGPYRAPEWPADKVAAIIEKLAPGSATVLPEVTGDAITKISVYASMNEVDVKGPEALLESYSQTLTDAGWTGDATNGFVSPAEDIKVKLSWNETYGLEITLFAMTIEWPAEQVAALVEAVVPGSTTVIPAITTDVDKITVYNSSWYQEIDVKGPETLLAAYAAILTDAGWTGDADNGFLSPAEDVIIELEYSSTYGLIIYVERAPVTTWPAAAVAALVTKLNSESETVIPAIDGGTDYQTVDYVSSYGVALIYVKGAETLLATYQSTLTTAGWAPLGGDADEGYDYASPAEDLQVNVLYDSKYGDLQITIQNYSAKVAEWPAADIAADLPGVTDTIPAFEGENDGFRHLNDAYGTAVVIYLKEGAAVADTIAAYQSTLTTAGFTAFGNGFVSPNGQIFVAVGAGADEGTLLVQYQAYSHFAEFPLDTVNEFLTQYDLGFQLTTALPDSAEAGYALTNLQSGSYHCLQILVSGNQVDDITSALDSILTAAGYTYDSSDDYYYNSDYHQVIIGYNAGLDVTYVNLWE